MKFHKKNIKDLDSWINKPARVILTNESSFYEGILLSEMRNGIMIESNKKRIYIPYESVLSIGGLQDIREDG